MELRVVQYGEKFYVEERYWGVWHRLPGEYGSQEEADEAVILLVGQAEYWSIH